MATKRMFNNNLIQTDDFGEMSQGAQLLYFYLNLLADDEGFNASPKRVMLMCKSSEEDLRQLVNHGYIIPMESGVVVIRHWLINNTLRADTYKPSIHVEEKEVLGAYQNGSYELLEVLPSGSKNLNTLQKKKGYKIPLTATDLIAEYKTVQLQLDSLQDDESVQVELNTFSYGNEGEGDKEENNKKVRERKKAPHEITPDNLYGEEKNVFLLPDEFEEIVNKYQEPFKLIDKISYILLNSTRRYPSHYGLIKKIALEDEWGIKPESKSIIKTDRIDKKEEDIQDIMKSKNLSRLEAEKIYEHDYEEAKRRVLEKYKK